MPTPKMRSSPSSKMLTASTGVPRMKIVLVAYSDHRNKGRRNQVRPGARMVWMVTMKFIPVRIDENPVIKTPTAIVTT